MRKKKERMAGYPSNSDGSGSILGRGKHFSLISRRLFSCLAEVQRVLGPILVGVLPPLPGLKKHQDKLFFVFL